MFKIVKNSTWSNLVQEVNQLRTKNSSLDKEILAVREGWTTAENRAKWLGGQNTSLQTKVNACADTKKHLRGKIEEQTAEIKKLKEQLTEAQFQLKLAKKEFAIPTSSRVRKPAAELPAAETPAPVAKKPYKKRTPKAGK